MAEVELERLDEVSMKEFSKFGRIIGRDEETEEGKYHLHPVDKKPVVETETIKAYWDLLPIPKTDVEGRFSIGTLFLKPKPVGEPLTWTEVHYETYEFFFPLDGPMIFVLAPQSEEPDPEETRAFLIDPGEGVLIDKGIWHYPPFSPSGVTTCVMPRFGHLAEVEGDVTKAYGKEYETPIGKRFNKGELHALRTDYYGEGFGGKYNIELVL